MCAINHRVTCRRSYITCGKYSEKSDCLKWCLMYITIHNNIAINGVSVTISKLISINIAFAKHNKL